MNKMSKTLYWVFETHIPATLFLYVGHVFMLHLIVFNLKK